MKAFKFLINTILIFGAAAAIVLAIITLVATAVCLSAMLGSLALAVHLLADKETPESATNGNDVDPITEIASLGKFSGILLRVFVLIIKENLSRLKFFTFDWVEGGARLFAQCFEFTLGLTQNAEMYKKTVAAAVTHSWAKKEG
jgi:hypothetical protein